MKKTNTAFWKRPPPPAWRDLRSWSLLIPGIAATAGAIMYAVQGFAASQGGVLPALWVEVAVRWGGVLLAVGAEGGTLSAMVEIARKRAAGKSNRWDAINIIVSLIATITARLMALQVHRGGAYVWILVIASAFDAYALMSEEGMYLTIRDEAMERYLMAKMWFDKGNVRNAVLCLNSEIVLPPREEPPPVTPPQVLEDVAQLKDGLTILQAQAPTLLKQMEYLQKRVSELQSAPPQVQLTVRQAAIIEAYRANAGASVNAVAKVVGCARATVDTELTALAAARLITRNGDGIEVLN